MGLANKFLNGTGLSRLVEKIKNYVKPNPTLAGTESTLTGIEINGTKYSVPQPTNVVANPTIAGTEADLTGLEVGSTKYKVPQGTPVTANPTLAGTESALTGLEVNGTKYKVPDSNSSMSNPMTATGDLIIGGTSGAPTRLALGTSGQVPKSNGTTIVWSTILPAVSPSDEGKFLRVDSSGQWVAETVPNANTQSF